MNVILQYLRTKLTAWSFLHSTIQYSVHVCPHLGIKITF